jgi:hypothetical protein
MSRCVAEYEGKFAVFCTVTDSFITDLMTLEELNRFYKVEYGNNAKPFQYTCESIKFEAAICGWISSQPVYDDEHGVIAWLKRNNVTQSF